MKLKITCLEDREIGVKGNPSVRYTGNDCTYASFSLNEPIGLTEEQKLTGMIYLMSDDDMLLNEINVDTFLRYVINDTETSSYLMLTNEPEPEPAPEPEPPTQEELLAMAKQGRNTAITSARDAAIYAGVDVTTSYGEEHFTLSDKDQTLLLGIYAMVQAGAPGYPYHSVNLESRSTNMCSIYTKEDIANLATAAFGHITYHESYANMLLQWLERETDVDTVYTIEYGAKLPQDLQDYLDMILTSANVDVNDTEGSGTASTTDPETQPDISATTSTEPADETATTTTEEQPAAVSTTATESDEGQPYIETTDTPAT